jgi:hypothetical protein
VAWKLPNSFSRCLAVYEKESTMKKLIALATACVLFAGMALAGQPSEANQKWLEVVQKKVAGGQTRISTPLEERAALLKDWAAKNGYNISVTQSEKGYRLQLTKHLAQN